MNENILNINRDKIESGNSGTKILQHIKIKKKLKLDVFNSIMELREKK